jgi:phage tail sheath gpL-like
MIKTKFDALPASLKPPVTLTSQIDGAGPSWEVIVECNNTGVLGHGFPLKVVSNTATTQTITADAAVLGTEQAGVGITTLTTALTAGAATRTHYIAFSDFVKGTTTTGAIAVHNHLKEKANGNNMLGGFLFVGFNGTLSNATTLASDIDSTDAERVYVCAHENGQTHPLVSAVSSAMQRASNSDVSRPSNGVKHNQVMAQVVGDRWTDTECNTALAGGVTPLRCDQDDNVNVKTIRMVCCRTDVATPLDIGTMEVLDELRDRIVARQNIRFVNFKVKQDGEEVYTSKCTTPSGVLAEAIGVCKEMEQQDKLQGIDANIDSFSASYVTGGKVALEIPAIVVPGLHRIMTKINLILT